MGWQPGGRMKRTRRFILPTVLSLLWALLFFQTPSAHAACVEQVKFKYDTGAYAYGTEAYIYGYDHAPNCGPATQTTFVRLSSSYLNFIETGYRQDVGNLPLQFVEWQIYPSSVQLDLRQNVNKDQWSSYRINNRPGTHTWDVYYQYGQSYSGMYLVDTVSGLLTDHGLIESEVARYGTASGATDVQLLESKSSSGAWSVWPGQACDPNQQGINDWDATSISNGSWGTNHSPVSGGC